MSYDKTVLGVHLVCWEIGDVQVTLRLPEGCPVPTVDLNVHTAHMDDDAREAALTAFGLTDEHLKGHGDSMWCTREVDDGTVRVKATVFLPDGATA